MAKKPKKWRASISLPPELYAVVKRNSYVHDRSVGATIRNVLKEHFKK